MSPAGPARPTLMGTSIPVARIRRSHSTIGSASKQNCVTIDISSPALRPKINFELRASFRAESNVRIAFWEAGDSHADDSQLLKDFRAHHVQAAVKGSDRNGAISANDKDAVDVRLTRKTRRKLLELLGALDVTRGNMGHRDETCAPQPRRRPDYIHRIRSRYPGQEYFSTGVETRQRRINDLRVVRIHLDGISTQRFGNAHGSACCLRHVKITKVQLVRPSSRRMGIAGRGSLFCLIRETFSVQYTEHEANCLPPLEQMSMAKYPMRLFVRRLVASERYV